MKIEGHLNIIEQEVKSLRVRLKDRVEVVRCKDCKYATVWTTRNGGNGGLSCESLLSMDVDEDFFCAFGEMKEKESVK